MKHAILTEIQKLESVIAVDTMEFIVNIAIAQVVLNFAKMVSSRTLMIRALIRGGTEGTNPPWNFQDPKQISTLTYENYPFHQRILDCPPPGMKFLTKVL